MFGKNQISPNPKKSGQLLGTLKYLSCRGVMGQGAGSGGGDGHLQRPLHHKTAGRTLPCAPLQRPHAARTMSSTQLQARRGLAHDALQRASDNRGTSLHRPELSLHHVALHHVSVHQCSLHHAAPMLPAFPAFPPAAPAANCADAGEALHAACCVELHGWGLQNVGLQSFELQDA